MSARSDHRPVVPGFYPDPTVCRVGDDYYLAHSSFEYFPGVPVWHSRDLMQWQQIGHILTSRRQFVRGDGRPSTGVYAGTLRHHEGLFWYITTNVSDYDSGQIILTADDPAGSWTDPVHVPEAIGIDPDLAWHEGECYLTWKAMDFTEGEIGILQARLDVSTGDLTETPYPVWQGSGLASAEGPHLYHIGEYWYLLLAEGGTERGHSVTIARGPSPAGPFESCPENPILTHRSSIHPTQNVGHADLVRTPDAGWAAVYLGTRPRGSTPGFHVLGRETFLAGVEWAQGWPVVHEAAFEIPLTATEWIDTFDGPDLDLRWVVPGGEPETIVERPTSEGIRILPAPNGSPDGAGLLCARVRDLCWIAEATLEGPGRFLLRLDHRHHYGLARQHGIVRATARIGDLDVLLGSVPVADDMVVLRIAASAPHSPPVPRGRAGPDEITLSVVTAQGALELARLDGRYLSTEVASGFTGRMLALGSTNGPAHFREISYRPHPEGATAPADSASTSHRSETPRPDALSTEPLVGGQP